MKLTEEQKKRFIKFGRKVWKMLTKDEQEVYYNDTGTVGFVEQVAVLLNISCYEVTIEEFELLHDAIIPF